MSGFKTTALLILAFLMSSAAFGQGLIKKYQSPPGYYTTESQIFDAYSNRMDFDGDGVPELVLEQVNEQGQRIELVVINHEEITLWHLDESDLETLGIVDVYLPFLGFFPVFISGHEVRYALFGGQGAGFLQGVEPATNQTLFIFPQRAGKAAGADTLRFALFDVDGDDYPDLIVSDAATQTVQVWGIGTTSTATEEAIEAALLHLFQSYPNPFRASTTIAYEVEQAGPVTVTVYDVLGRVVRRLVDGYQTVGAHAVVWDGRDATGRAVAAGTYFYRLRVGDAVRSKQTIRVK